MADSIVGFPFEALLGASGVPRSQGDAALVEGLREGRECAYETLVSEYQQPVYNLVWRLLDNSSDAADVSQEVFLKVFRRIGAFRGQSTLKTWIYRIAVNEAYNHRRWFSRHCQRQEPIGGRADCLRNGADAFPGHGPSPLDLACDGETRSMIEDALSRLNPNFRAAVVLRDIEDLTYEEIAAVLGVSLGTVKSRILRGREALRKELAGSHHREAEPGWVSLAAK